MNAEEYLENIGPNFPKLLHKIMEGYARKAFRAGAGLTEDSKPEEIWACNEKFDKTFLKKWRGNPDYIQEGEKQGEKKPYLPQTIESYFKP